MKTLEEIVAQEPVYLNDWEGEDKFGVISDFEDIYIKKADYEATESPYPNEDYWKEKKDRMTQAINEWQNIHILFASYGQANYSGDAWVLFEQGGELFEVSGGHCSCYGLEGQWSPEEVSLQELEHRLLEGTFGEDNYSDNNFKEELCKFLGVEFKLNTKKSYYDYN